MRRVHIATGYSAPEEDIIHVINGEIWLDELGTFSHIRSVLGEYYPEPVRLRRIAHWCRYFSGMGAYALKRAILRDNEYYATIVFSRAVRWAVQLAFYAGLSITPTISGRIPFLSACTPLCTPLGPLVAESVRLFTPWGVAGVAQPNSRRAGSATWWKTTSSSRIPSSPNRPLPAIACSNMPTPRSSRKLPPELRGMTPVWEQIYWEQNHSLFVASLDLPTWDSMLNLHPEGVTETKL